MRLSIQYQSVQTGLRLSAPLSIPLAQFSRALSPASVPIHRLRTTDSAMLFFPIVICHLLSIQVVIPVSFDEELTSETLTFGPFTVANDINQGDIKDRHSPSLRDRADGTPQLH